MSTQFILIIFKVDAWRSLLSQENTLHLWTNTAGWLATALHAAWDNRGARTGCLSRRGPSCQQTYAAKIKQGFTGRRWRKTDNIAVKCRGWENGHRIKQQIKTKTREKEIRKREFENKSKFVNAHWKYNIKQGFLRLNADEVWNKVETSVAQVLCQAALSNFKA